MDRCQVTCGFEVQQNLAKHALPGCLVPGQVKCEELVVILCQRTATGFRLLRGRPRAVVRAKGFMVILAAYAILRQMAVPSATVRLAGDGSAVFWLIVLASAGYIYLARSSSRG